jgi:hypothetical protein
MQNLRDNALSSAGMPKARLQYIAMRGEGTCSDALSWIKL